MIPTFRRPAAALVALLGTVLLAALLVLPAQTAGAAPVAACAASPNASLCLSHDFSTVKAGTTTPSRNTQDPVDVGLSFENTSTGHEDEAGQPRWLTQVSANLLGSADGGGLIAPSATLPDGLLLAGSAAACGNKQNFTACTAGSGTGSAVKAAAPLLGTCTVCDLTFGIQRIENERDNLGTSLVQLKVTLSVCMNKQTLLGLASWDCRTATQTVSLGQLGQPRPFVLTAPPHALATRTGITTAAIQLQGLSNKLASGTTTAQTYVTARLPMKCGANDASASARAVNGATVSVPRSMEILQCAQLAVTRPASRVLFGGSTTVTGSLRFYDRLPDGGVDEGPIVFEPVTVRACPPTAVVPCSATPRTTRTDSRGKFAFSLKPIVNTRYFIAYAGFDDDPIHVPGSFLARNVNVAPRITRAADRATIRSGQTVRISGLVAPRHAGRTVYLQRVVSGAWRTVASAKLSSTSRYARSIVLKGSRGSTARLRVVLPAHGDHLVGTSSTVRIAFS